MDLVGEKLHEPHAAAALSAAAFDTGIEPAFALLAPATTGPGCRYQLFLELPGCVPATESPRFAVAVEAELCRNFHYAHARRLGQLAALEPVCVRADAMAAYRSALMAVGIKAGDVKQPALRGESFWQDVFAAAGATPPVRVGTTLG